MSKNIQTTAKNYQELDRKIKDLQAKQKPLKKELLDYAEKNKKSFDEAFQLKFENGTYVSQRIKDVIVGSTESKTILLDFREDFVKVQLDEAEVIAQAKDDNRLKKLMKKHDLKIEQKETLAVYAG